MKRFMKFSISIVDLLIVLVLGVGIGILYGVSYTEKCFFESVCVTFSAPNNSVYQKGYQNGYTDACNKKPSAVRKPVEIDAEDFSLKWISSISGLRNGGGE